MYIFKDFILNNGEFLLSSIYQISEYYILTGQGWITNVDSIGRDSVAQALVLGGCAEWTTHMGETGLKAYASVLGPLAKSLPQAFYSSPVLMATNQPVLTLITGCTVVGITSASVLGVFSVLFSYWF